jgi:hypothetical protein
MILRVFLTVSLMLMSGCATGSGGTEKQYMCPMHKEVTSTSPGKCAKCGTKMAATQPTTKPAEAAHVH